MRAEFAEAVVELAERDERVVLLTGDLGFTILEPFADRFPGRFFNVGVAEQNLVGLATGLADAGFVPFTYSIATFASMRPYEFIRNGPVLHQLPVRMVGVGGGLDYGYNGVTHYALEDVGIMRLQPGLTTIVPADPDQARRAVEATADLHGPVYFRVGKEAQPIPGLDGHFELGRTSVIRDGADLALVALGPAAREALGAADILEERGFAAKVAVVSTVSPTSEDDIAELLSDVPLAVSVESHYATGGVGTMLAEVVAGRGLDARVLRCGVKDMPRGEIGTQQYLYDRHGLSSESVADAVVQAISPAGR